MDDFKLLNKVIDTSPHIICIIDENDIIQWQNSYAEKFFKKDTTGENIRKLLSIEPGAPGMGKNRCFYQSLEKRQKRTDS